MGIKKYLSITTISIFFLFVSFFIISCGSAVPAATTSPGNGEEEESSEELTAEEIEELEEAIEEEFGLKLTVQQWMDQDDELNESGIRSRVLEEVVSNYKMKEQLAGSEALRRFEKHVMLQVLDSHWKGHLAAMDYLRQSIGLRGYAQKNPKQEYKRESFEMFSEMLEKIKQEVVSILSKVQIQQPDDVEVPFPNRRRTPVPC